MHCRLRSSAAEALHAPAASRAPELRVRAPAPVAEMRRRATPRLSTQSTATRDRPVLNRASSRAGDRFVRAPPSGSCGRASTSRRVAAPVRRAALCRECLRPAASPASSVRESRSQRTTAATRALAPMLEALDAKDGYSNEHVVAVRSIAMAASGRGGPEGGRRRVRPSRAHSRRGRTASNDRDRRRFHLDVRTRSSRRRLQSLQNRRRLPSLRYLPTLHRAE